MNFSRLYIAILDDFPDYMVPTLVAHSMLGAHKKFTELQSNMKELEATGPYLFPIYMNWYRNSFRKCVVRVNQKEFDKIAALSDCYLGHENTTLEGRKACAIPLPYDNKENIPNVLKYAKLWKPKGD